MAQLLGEAAATTQARAAAEAAAASSGCRIQSLHDLDELATATGIFGGIWARPGAEPIVRLELMRALTHAGNYAAGAYVDGRMVGAVLGFLGKHDDAICLHSHIMGFLPDTRGRGMGRALKLHQRSWALDRGIDTATWTFDPLVRLNAYFNLVKLGADATAYYQNFYGTMDDAVNAGDETDRMFITWALRSRRTAAASEGSPQTIEESDLTEARILLDEDEAGRPAVTGATGGDRLLCRVPSDIVALRRQDANLAGDWRRATRDTLGAAISEGYRATSVTRSGWYVLDRDDQ